VVPILSGTLFLSCGILSFVGRILLIKSTLQVVDIYILCGLLDLFNVMKDPNITKKEVSWGWSNNHGNKMVYNGTTRNILYKYSCR
jgi:hypothetical protein